MPCSFCIICTIQPVNIWMSISLLASNTRSTLSVCTIFQHPHNVIECPPLKFPYLSPPIFTHPSLPTCQTPPKCLPFPPVKPHPSNCPSPVLTGTNIMICKYDDMQIWWYNKYNDTNVATFLAEIGLPLRNFQKSYDLVTLQQNLSSSHLTE